MTGTWVRSRGPHPGLHLAVTSPKRFMFRRRGLLAGRQVSQFVWGQPGIQVLSTCKLGWPKSLIEIVCTCVIFWVFIFVLVWIFYFFIFYFLYLCDFLIFTSSGLRIYIHIDAASVWDLIANMVVAGVCPLMWGWWGQVFNPDKMHFLRPATLKDRSPCFWVSHHLMDRWTRDHIRCWPPWVSPVAQSVWPQVESPGFLGRAQFHLMLTCQPPRGVGPWMFPWPLAHKRLT